MSTKRTSKMSSHLLCGSPTYVWSTGNVLGKGATGAVYQGIHKVTGESVAVKTFNHLSHMRPDHVQIREFEVLKKVNHDNIVRLQAIEQEQGTENKVLVMELCTGGSLFNILDDPENTYGLQEDEFLLVLEHVSAGMKHLRDNNIVHRDLKPGNIMKFIMADGRSLYKLTDFGAARELPDDQQFMSLYGTEEYLHPDMYERAVLRKSASKTFGATVDLWSIGVTLYHVATGSLPFRPYGGRKNKETMYRITTSKQSGIISGAQVSENGPIEWSNRLPETCQLSMGLQKLIMALLAGLLESDPSKIWTFDQFFAFVTNILAHRRLHVFFVNRIHMLHVYIKPDAKLEELLQLIKDQTEFPCQQQILIHDNRLFCDGSMNISRSEKYPETTDFTPLFLFRKEDTSVLLNKIEQIPKYPPLSTYVSLDADATVGKVYCSTAHSMKRLVERCCAAVKLLNFATLSLFAVLQSRVAEGDSLVTAADALLERDNQRTQLLKSCFSFGASILDVIFSDSMDKVETSSKDLRDLVIDKEESGHTVTENLKSVVRKLTPLSERITISQRSLCDWKTFYDNLQDLSRCPVTAGTYVQRIRDSWQILCRDRNARSLSYNEEQFHALEKTKLSEASQRLQNLYQNECLRVAQQTAERMSSWLHSMWNDYRESLNLQGAISSFQDMLRVHKNALDEAQLVFDGLLNRELQKINDEWVARKRDSETTKQDSRPEEDHSYIYKKQKARHLLKENLSALRILQEEVAAESKQSKQLISQFKDVLSCNPPLADFRSLNQGDAPPQ